MKKSSLLHCILAAMFGSGIVRLCLGLGVVENDPASLGASLVELIEQRKQLNKKIETLLAVDTLTDDQRSEYETHNKELRALDEKINRQTAAIDSRKKQIALEQRSSQVTPVDHSVQTGNTPGEQRDLKKFSLARALRHLAAGTTPDGIEAEIAQEGVEEARAAGISIKPNSIMVGSRALSGAPERRDHTVGGSGGNLVQTDIGNLLDSLFENLVFSNLGADINTGLVGNLQINRMVRGTPPAEKAENAAADEYTITFEPHELTPRRLPTYLDVSNQLLIQSQERNLERRVTNHVTTELRVEMEKSYILDILATSGIGDIVGGPNGARPTYGNIVDIAGALTAANVNPNAITYLINSTIRSYLQKAADTVDGSGDPIDSMKILPSNADTLAGRPYVTTNLVPNDLDKGTSIGIANAIIAADFSGLSIGQWSGIEFLSDPYTQATLGMTRIHAAVYHDSVVNDPAKFSAMQDALIVPPTP